MEKPILFSYQMVRAILSGRKTQTRRLVKESRPVQYGRPGDKLWVREAWTYHDARYWYRADMIQDDSGDRDGWWHRELNVLFLPGPVRWKPSIHMPRAACRIELEVQSVRVERINNISEEDAYDEGAERAYIDHEGKFMSPSLDTERVLVPYADYRTGFQCLWESIHGKKAWEENPLVWVIQFKLIL